MNISADEIPKTIRWAETVGKDHLDELLAQVEPLDVEDLDEAPRRPSARSRAPLVTLAAGASPTLTPQRNRSARVAPRLQQRLRTRRGVVQETLPASEEEPEDGEETGDEDEDGLTEYERERRRRAVRPAAQVGGHTPESKRYVKELREVANTPEAKRYVKELNVVKANVQYVDHISNFG